MIARTSSFRFRDDRDVREIARLLDVTHLIDGSVRKAGDRVRITAQLIDAQGGFQLWSQRYDRELDDVFAIQEEIATQIANRLSARLADADQENVPRRHLRQVADLTAYDAYLRGRHQQALFDANLLGTAVDCFQEAIDTDPQFAPAYAGLAEAYSIQAIGLGLARHDTMPRATEAADRALDLAPELPDAHVARAIVDLLYNRKYHRAKLGLDRAIALNPSYADAYVWSEFYWTYIAGDYDAAVRATTRAEELSPLDPTIRCRLGVVHNIFGRLDRAVDNLRALTNAEPNHAIFHMILADALGRRGDNEESKEAGERALAMSKLDRAMIATLGTVGAHRGLAGDERGARVLLAELERRAKAGYLTAYWQSSVYAGLGRLDEAFACLDEALEQRDCNLIYVYATPRRFRLHDDPRFASLLERLNLSHLVAAD